MIPIGCFEAKDAASRMSASGDNTRDSSRGTATLGAAIIPLQRPQPPQVSFDRGELRAILNLYGRKVAEGEWRDYAIDFFRDMAVFSVFRRTSEMPLYRIVKNPALARKQGAYSVVASGGQILKRGAELERVLRVFESGPKLVPV
jgi:hypothetical protein